MRDFNQDPLIVIWEVTQACGLACFHCRAEARPGRDPRELSTDEGRALIDEVARFHPPLFVLTGGDPMERPDLDVLVRHAVGRGLKVGLSPSATPKVTFDRLKAMKDAGLHRMAVSLDSADASGHDAFRGVPGSYQRTMDIAADARRLGLPLQIGTTISRRNFGELDALAARVQEMGALVWSVFFLVPTGRADASMGLTADEAEDFLVRLQALSKTVHFAIKTTEAPQFRRIQIESGGRKASSVPGIVDGRGFVFISHTGDVRPSGFLPMTAGNVRESSLTALYRDAPLFRSLRDESLLKGRCGVCEYRRVCGGSRARAYAMTGDPLESDPLCPYVPKGGALVGA